MQYQKPVLIQEQRLRMSPQLLQSIQIMNLPLQDLRLRIHEELEKNPALEIVEEVPDEPYEEAPRKQSEELEYFEESSDPGFSRGYDDEAGDAKRRFMEGALSRPESLQEHLLWQLSLQPIPRRGRDLGELLIRNLDQNGFHRDSLDRLVPETDQVEARRVAEMIQTFEPVGTCVADYRESLLVQARLKADAPASVEPILREHLLLLERGKLKEVAKKLKIAVDEVEAALKFIKTLTPFPGRLYSIEKPTYVVPDLMVRLKDGQFVIILNDEEIPVLGINPFFEGIKDGSNQEAPKVAKQFVNAKLREGQWFIHSIHQRNQTLLKVARAIIEFQRDFFLRGPKYLRPLILKDIAREIGVHEATVSRITTAKYIQTEWGIFELKYFFSNSISGTGSNGARFSKEGVKQVVKELLEEQRAAGATLSDQKIADLLAQRGIKLARRTVAKYRNELDIGSSYER